MLGGFLIIFFEIENPFRMFLYDVISPNLTSNLWWMGTLYGAYPVFMMIEYYCLLEQNHRNNAPCYRGCPTKATYNQTGPPD
jgi:Fe-S-cluster-containing dehydrogenase component